MDENGDSLAFFVTDFAISEETWWRKGREKEREKSVHLLY